MSVIADNQIAAELGSWCASYADTTLKLAFAFLIFALLGAIVETAVALWLKVKFARKEETTPDIAEAVRVAPDPIKLLEALKGALEAVKGLLETLKGLPAWVAVFLAGLALLWTAMQRPDGCVSPETNASGNQTGTNLTGTSGTADNRTGNAIR